MGAQLHITAVLCGAPFGRLGLSPNPLVGHGGCGESGAQPPVPASQVRKPAGRYTQWRCRMGADFLAAPKARVLCPPLAWESRSLSTSFDGFSVVRCFDRINFRLTLRIQPDRLELT